MALAFRQPSVDISANVSILSVGSVVVNILFFLSFMIRFNFSRLKLDKLLQ